MASNELFDTGIKVTGSFSAAGSFPVDGKYVVNTVAERDDHVTQNRAYDGMQVYVKENKKTYQYVIKAGVGQWKDFCDETVYRHAVENKGIAVGITKGDSTVPGLYKIKTNNEGHVVEVSPITKTDITDLDIAVNGIEYGVGGDELGLVKNGGNVTINADGSMTAPEGGGGGSYISKGEKSFATNDSTIAIAQYSDASGRYSQAGCHAFTITAIDVSANTYTLDSVEGLEIGDVYSASVCYTDGTSSWCYEYGKITAINGNVVKVDNIFCEKNFEAKDSYITDYGIDIGENVFIISSKPIIGTRIIGDSSHTEGNGTVAVGKHSHAEGDITLALGGNSHSEGNYTVASGVNSHAEGFKTTASGDQSHAEGGLTRAVGNFSHAQGYQTYSGGSYAHIEGKSDNALPMTVEDRTYDHTSSNDELLERWSSNKFALAKGKASHVEGVNCLAFGVVAHAEGNATIASGPQSHAEGRETKASGGDSHAEGFKTTASGGGSHAEGDYTVASGGGSHAEGGSTKASGHYTHAEGLSTIASGYASHAEGNSTKASSYYTHAEGLSTVASGHYQHVQGMYNIEDTENKYAHIVGGGSFNLGKFGKNNIHTLDWEGNASFAGSVKSNGEDYAEFFEWLDGNSDNEDRVGLLVTLDGEKIKLANAGDEILGVISGTVAVLGSNYEWEWNGKYLTDDFGRVIYDLVEEFIDVEHIEFKEVEKEVIDEETNETKIEIELEEVKTVEKQSLGFWKHPRINPDYDPEQKYINRTDRPEWDTVGMLGKLYVRDDGTCQVNGYATVGEDGIATASAEKTNIRVLSRVNENVIRVLLK